MLNSLQFINTFCLHEVTKPDTVFQMWSNECWARGDNNFLQTLGSLLILIQPGRLLTLVERALCWFTLFALCQHLQVLLPRRAILVFITSGSSFPSAGLAFCKVPLGLVLRLIQVPQLLSYPHTNPPFPSIWCHQQDWLEWSILQSIIKAVNRTGPSIF